MPSVSGGFSCECLIPVWGPWGWVSHLCLTVQSLAGAHGFYSVCGNPFKNPPCLVTSVSNPHPAPTELGSSRLAQYIYIHTHTNLCVGEEK